MTVTRLQAPSKYGITNVECGDLAYSASGEVYDRSFGPWTVNNNLCVYVTSSNNNMSLK